jgi:hypothetical protein
MSASNLLIGQFLYNGVLPSYLIFSSFLSCLSLRHPLSALRSIVEGYVKHGHIIIVFLWNIHTNYAIHSPYRIVWHETPGNQVRSYRLSLSPFPLIHAVFAWAEDRVPIPSMGFGIGEKLAGANHVPLVCSGPIHPLSIHLCTTKYWHSNYREINNKWSFMNNNCCSKQQFILHLFNLVTPFLENIIVH